MIEPNEALSEREIEILRLVATGAANKEIANTLSISPNTVKVHLRNIFTKIGVASRTEATLYAIKQGIVSSPFTSTPVLETDTELLDVPVPDNPLALSLPLDDERHAVSRPRASRLFLILYPWFVGIAAIIFISLLLFAGTNLVKPTATLVPTRLAQPSQIPLNRWETDLHLPEKRKGMGAAVYESHFYLIAGETDTGITNHTLEFDPTTRTWNLLAGKPTAVTDIHAAVLGEKIYVPGGKNAAGQPINLLEVFDPRQNIWTTQAKLPVALSGYALTAFEGNLYLFGGWNGKANVASVYSYNPELDQWKARQDLPAPLAFATAVAIDGKIFLIGGFDGKSASPQVLAYIPSRDTPGSYPWESAPNLSEGRFDMAGVSLANNVYLIGGQTTPQSYKNLQPLVLVQGSTHWQAFDTPVSGVGDNPAAVVSGNFIHIFGGSSQQSISDLHIKYQALYTIAIPVVSGNSTP